MNVRSGSVIENYFLPVFMSLITAAVLGGITGCSSVKQEPFAKFNEAVKNTQTAVEAAGPACQTFTKDDFPARFLASGKDLKVLEIKPDSKNTAYPWGMPNYNSNNPKELPTFLQMKRALIAIKTLNIFFYQYTNLLKTLADPSLVSDDNFTALKNQVSATGKDAWAALNPNASSAQTAEAVAVNSLLADLTADVWKNVLKAKQVKLLQEILQKYQAAIEAYANHGANHVQNLINDTTNYYQNKAEKLEAKWGESSSSDKEKTLQEMLTLNEQFINIITVLTELKQTYQKIPPAYADLIRSLTDKKNSLDSLDELYYFSQRLQIIVDNLKKSN